MSEKRFKRGMNLSCFDTETRKSYWYACNLCGLLNELVEENKQLRKEHQEMLEKYVLLKLKMGEVLNDE